jgi:hypothetical protein
MTAEPAALRPPPEHEHRFIHFLQYDDESRFIATWQNNLWHPWAHDDTTPAEAAGFGWRYLGPAEVLNPAAAVVDAEDEAAVEMVARAICIANGRDPDAPRWRELPSNRASGICWHENKKAARAVLTALRDSTPSRGPQSIRRAILDEAIAAISAEDLCDEKDDPTDAAYSRAIRDCKDVLTALRDMGKSK